MGRYENDASVMDIAQKCGISEGSVLDYMARCLTAIESLHGMFVQKLTEEEKEVEKAWIEKEVGFKGLWREGYLMYDGTIIVLYSKPSFEGGSGYFTCKSNYGLNVQVYEIYLLK